MARTRKQDTTPATVPAGGDKTVIRSSQIAFYFQAIDAYTNAEKDFDSAKDACAKAAFELLSGATDHIQFFEIRDQLKEAYIAKRNPTTDDEKTKATNAANMLWSRTVARATSKGFKSPEIPQTPEAVARQVKRQANREAKGKTAYEAAIAAGASEATAQTLKSLAMDGRKAKAIKNEANKPANTPADLSDDAIAVARQIDAQDNDGQLFDALDYVLSNASTVAIFITWATAQAKATRVVRAA